MPTLTASLTLTLNGDHLVTSEYLRHLIDTDEGTITQAKKEILAAIAETKGEFFVKIIVPS